MSDPPWRLDPFQTILRVKGRKNKKKKPGGGPQEPGPGKPTYCYSDILGCCPGCCSTCFCPGILCIGPQGCCGLGKPPCYGIIGFILFPVSPLTCFSGQFIFDILQACPGNCNPGDIELSANLLSMPPGFVPISQLPPS
jgi:hypothetical protein